jgi:hypothetical protein
MNKLEEVSTVGVLAVDDDQGRTLQKFRANEFDKILKAAKIVAKRPNWTIHMLEQSELELTEQEKLFEKILNKGGSDNG